MVVMERTAGGFVSGFPISPLTVVTSASMKRVIVNLSFGTGDGWVDIVNGGTDFDRAPACEFGNVNLRTSSIHGVLQKFWRCGANLLVQGEHEQRVPLSTGRARCGTYVLVVGGTMDCP